MAQNKTSKSAEAYFARYKTQGIFAKNRKLKLERALKKHPNNTQIANALKETRSYRRRTPTVSKWTPTSIAQTKLARLFKVIKQVVNTKTSFNKKPKFGDFSIGARDHNGVGNLV